MTVDFFPARIDHIVMPFFKTVLVVASLLWVKAAVAEETANKHDTQADNSSEKLSALDVKIVGVRVNAGTIAIGGTATFFHLWWKYFYLETLRLSFGAMPDIIAFVGTVIGFPLFGKWPNGSLFKAG